MSAIFSYNSDSVTLRNPLLGDSKTHVVGVSTRINMRGGIYAWKKTTNTKRLLMNFVEVSCGELEDFKVFISAYSGKIVTLSVLNYLYTGYIINNPFEITRGRTDSFVIEFEILTEESTISPSPGGEPEPGPPIPEPSPSPSIPWWVP